MTWLALVVAPQALAADDAPRTYRPNCHASSTIADPAPAVFAKAKWRCDDSGWSNESEMVWLRFDAKSWSGQPKPVAFHSHMTRISGVTVATVDDRGATSTRHLAPSDLEMSQWGPFFTFDLPEVTANTSALLVGIERPHNVTVLTQAGLTDRRGASRWLLAQLVTIAMVVGMLLVPLFFDIAFYLVLRERFVMIHFAMVCMMLLYVLIATNLVGVFDPLPMTWLAIAAPTVWALGTGLSAFFIPAFLEPGALSRPMRRALHFTGAMTMVVPTFFALQLDATQSFDNSAYFYSLAVLIVVICLAIGHALARGSRSARFLAAAWTPVIAASFDRLLRGLGVYEAPAYVDQFLYVALGLEVMLISLGIADRLLVMRRQRDHARAEAESSKHLADRDALTGLLNRRAVEPRFTALREEGFDTFAVIDLDLFKDINDRFGHQTGDRVLCACAAVLKSDYGRNAIAMRLGGEEFMLLLRGRGTLRRAEAVRQAIPSRIASEVEGLDRPITASMGVVEIPRSGFEAMTFAELYARADKLLYEAKRAGRNRTMSERLRGFGPGPAKARHAA